MTRAMFVTVLARLDGVDASDNVQPFDDVASGTWCAGEVAWAAANGIVSGIGSNQFAPNEPVSRQQMATFMARYIEYYAEKNKVTFTATGSTAAFSDAGQIAEYAVKAVALCRSYGLVNGNPDGSFGPTAQSTRAQVAAVVHRLALLLPTGKPVTTPGGGGSIGGGGSTSASNSASTAAGFIEAAQKSATNVTATVEATNSITVSDDIPITNNGVTNLTLNLGNASVGDLTVNSTSATTIILSGATASVSTLTINAPNATVTNGVKVNGSVNIKAVSHNTFNNTALISGNINIQGPGALNDTSEIPAAVVVSTDAKVDVRGKSDQIKVTADNAKLTLAGTVAPTVNSSASGVALTVNTAATIVGTVGQLTTTASDLTVDGTVGTLTANNALTLRGGGAVTDLTAGGDVEVADTAALTVSTVNASGNATITAPDNRIGTVAVAAGSSVNLNASVSNVVADAGVAVSVAEDKTVNNLVASGDLTLSGSGAIGSVDVTSNAKIEAAPESTVAVTAVTAPEGVTVTTTVAPVTVKAAKPTGVGFTAPTTAGGQGSITGVTTAMEYSSDNMKTWTPFDSDPKALSAGTYQVRVKATDAALASEAVTVTIPVAVAVSAAAIQGTPYVGQTLTAVANATATGTLSYEWKAGDVTISNASGKSFTLTDAQIGKTITVTISNYGRTSSATSSATAAVTVDKTPLDKLLSKAAEVQQGVFEKANDATAATVAEGIIFVTTAEKTALTNAVSAATTVKNNTTATTDAVTAQETALRTAINTYVAAKKTGTFNEVATLKSELAELITAANGAKVTTNTDAALVTPGVAWALEADNNTYTDAISAATAVKDNSTATAAQLAKAITDLNAAINTYIKVIRTGAALDNTALLAAINAAEINAASVVTSNDGTDILPSQTWVTSTVLGAYTSAITTAKGVAATTQSQNTAALTALNGATDTFNTAKAPGTKDIIAPIVTGVSATEGVNNAFTIKFTSNEAGTYQYQVGSTEGDWTTPGSNTVEAKENTFTYTLTTASATVYVKVSDESGNATIVSVALETEASKNAEASINNTKYATLAEAVTTAKNGQTVKLLKDVAEGSGIIVDGSANRTFTIDLGGHSYTVTKDLAGSTNTKTQGFQLLQGSTITIKNGTLSVNATAAKMLIQNYANLILDGVTLDGTKLPSGDGYVMSNNCGKTAVGGVALTGDTSILAGTGVVAMDVSWWPSAYPLGAQVTLDTTGTIGGNIELGLYGKNNTAENPIPTPVLSTLKITNATLTGTITTYNAKTGNYATGLTDEQAAAAFASMCSITGGTFSADPGAYVPDGYAATESGGKFTVAPKTTADANDVATVGGIYFKTLQGAVNAAGDGETVKLLNHIKMDTAKDIVTIPSTKNIVLNMNGKIIDVTENFVGRPIVSEGTLIITGNGTIDSSASEKGGYGAVNNKGTLTIENGTYRGAIYAGGSAIRNTGATAILTIQNGTFEKATCAVFNEGTATINNGTFIGKTCSTCNKDCWSYTIRNYATNARMTINGGTFVGTQGAVSSSVGYLEINDGTFKTVDCDKKHGAIFYALYAAGEVGKVECVVNGGHFETDGKITAALVGNDNIGGDGGINERATARITGGTFKAPEGVPALKGAKKTGDPVVTGGTFSTDPSAYVAADHAAVKNPDNTYTVFSTSEVDTADKLKAAMLRNANITLTDDITLPNTWVPAGGTVSTTPIPGGGDYPKVDVTTENPFTGTLNGNNHSITVNVVDNQFADKAWTGTLFTAVENATIKDLTVNATINNPSTTANIAGIAGMSKNTTYENVTVTGENTSCRPSGITGYSEDDVFTGCTVSMDLTAERKASGLTVVGGLAQQISGTNAEKSTTFTNCTYSGTITVDGSVGTGSIWAGAMYGGTSYSTVDSVTVYFPLTLVDCTFNGTLNITPADGVSIAAHGTWTAPETSGSKTEYFSGLLGRTHKDLEVSVTTNGIAQTSAKGELTYSSATTP